MTRSPMNSNFRLPQLSTLLLLSVFANGVSAEASVLSSLSKTDDQVTFTLLAPKAEVPGCVDNAKKEQWAFSDSGNAGFYSLLTLANTQKYPVEVTSASACNTDGIEVAANVHIVYPQVENEIAKVSANTNFMARSTITLASEAVLDSVEFGLSSNGGSINWQTAATVNEYHEFNFGRLPVGSYTLITKATSGEEIVQDTRTFDVVNENAMPVYREKATGDLYFELLQADGSVYVKLSKDENDVWVYETLTKAQWDALDFAANFDETDYTIAFGDYNGDGVDDFRLSGDTTGNDITLVFDGNGYTELPADEAPSPEVPTAPSAPSASNSSPVGETIGMTAGEFRVDESGAATYSIPFSLPQGIAGVTPSVGLSYHSSGGNGTVGIGWNISGLSAISRCRQTFEQDGNTAKLHLDNNDRFCLDGQKLKAVSGEYGADGTVYLTEIASNVRVTSKGTLGSGPAYFEVKKADGSVSYYGNQDISSAARPDGVVTVEDNTALVWNLTSTSDNLEHTSNSIFYHYETGGANSSSLGENEQVIDYIEYSDNTIDFVYQTNSSRTDRSFSFLHGKKFTYKALLDRVDISNHDNAEVRSYEINYEVDNVTKLQRVDDIKECVGTTCLPATDFNWYNQIQWDVGSAMNETQLASGALSAYQNFDLDGDGYSDIVYVVKSSGNYKLHVNYNNNGSFNEQVKLDQFTLEDDEEVKLIPVDIDGDSHTEIVYLRSYAGKNYWHYYDLNDAEVKNFQDDRTGRDITQTSYIKRLSIHTEDTGEDINFHDVNADAYPDIVYRKDRSHILLNDKQGGFEAQAVDFRYPAGQSPNEGIATDPVKLLTSLAPADFNNDGVSDAVFRIRDTQFDGVDFAPNHTSYYWWAYELTQENGTYTYRPIAKLNSQGQTREIPTAYNILVGDFNQDGLGDILYRSHSSASNAEDIPAIWQVKYSTGASFEYKNNVYFTDSNGNSLTSKDIKAMQLVDVDMNGQTDIVLFNGDTKTWQVAYHKEGQFNAPVDVYVDQAFNNSVDGALLGDWDADGVLNVARIDYGANKFLPFRDSNSFLTIAGNRVYEITNGLGLKTTIEYSQMTYSSASESVNAVYKKGSGAEDLAYGRCQPDCTPVFDLVYPNHLVKRVLSDAPSYDATGESFDANNRVSVTYKYEAARMQAGGRGSLGFEKVTTIDNQTGIRTTTEYSQEFPYIGMPLKTTRTTNQSEVISFAENKLNSHSMYGGEVVFPYIEKATDSSYDVDAPTNLLSKVETTNTYTQYGSNVNYYNLTEVDVKTYQGDALFSTVTTTNQYTQENEANWWVGRVTKATAKHERTNSYSVGNEADITRVSDFSYYSSTGLLQDESVNGLTTLHCYDDFGRKIEETTYAGLGSELTCSTAPASVSFSDNNLNHVYRTKRMGYGSNNSDRYLKTVSDGFTTVETYNERNTLGQVTKKTDVNNVVTYVGYDAFGRQYYSNNSLGEKVVISRTKDSTSFTGNYYAETVTADGKPTVKTYVNKLGQTIGKAKQHFDGSWVKTDIRYDELGRTVRQSNPYTSSPSHWSSSVYDDYNRVTSSVSANGVTSTIAHDGYTTTYTTELDNSHSETSELAATQIKVELKNVAGELVSVKDNAATRAASSIRYHYNHTGNLTKVINIDDAEIVNIYDSYGRKTQTRDPNKGTWEYSHNALGELISQTSARNHVTTTYRDQRGRTRLKQTKQGATVLESIDYSYEGHLLDSQTNSEHTKTFNYDSYGRINTVQTLIDTTTYTQQTTYDQYGRVFQQFDPDASSLEGCLNSSNATVGSCYGIQNEYNSYGYLAIQREARYGSNGRIYQQVTAMDAFGNVTHFAQNNGAITSVKSFNEVTGLISSISANNGDLQSNSYTFDKLGNLRTRTNSTLKAAGKGHSEKFYYDSANRLVTVDDLGTGSNEDMSVQYYENGNIKHKSGVGYYCYSSGRPNALSGIGSAENCTSSAYQYDDNGNMTSGRNRSIVYGHFDKATSITNTADNSRTTFNYDANHSRYKRVTTETVDNKQVTKTTYYIGNVEVIREEGSNVILTRRNLPGAIENRRTNGTADISFILKDHLGSIDTIVDEQNKIVTKLYFDAWGKKQIVDLNNLNIVAATHAQISLAGLLDVTSRGYTGHEHVDHADIIHMNGRIYDATLGRMLQADPFIQAPTNSQSYNRYSYVLNNPLSMTDPSGYFFRPFKKFERSLIRGAAKIFGAQLVNMVGSIVSSIYGGPWGAAAWSYEFTRAMGGSMSQALRGAFTAGASAFVFSQIGKAFDAESGFWKTGGTEHIAAHAVTGGVISHLQGGKFGHGFLAAGLTKGFQASEMMSSDPVAATIQSAVIGGTASAISGGKFANGAVTAAFQYLYNYARSQEAVQKEKLAVGASTKAIAKFLGSNRFKLGIKIDSEGKVIIDGSADLDKLKISLTSDMQAKVVGGSGAFTGQSFSVNAPEAQKAVASFGLVEIAVAGYNNGVVNFDIKLGSGAYVQYSGGFDLRNWGPAGAYIRRAHFVENSVNSYFCKAKPSTPGC